MKLHELADRPGARKKRHRIGRGIGSGEFKAKAAFSVWGASKSAVAAVEKAGGSVTVLAPKPQESEAAA